MTSPEPTLKFLQVMSQSCRREGAHTTGRPPRDLMKQNHWPAAWVMQILSNWYEKGWFNYSSCLDKGWLTPLGVRELKKLVAGP